ncbi:MAG: FCD domain-containing protein, partial [Micromonosporaceae bacterium]|nr:FCD domain-containing protein [Micromonosporaceae bacterium]
SPEQRQLLLDIVADTPTGQHSLGRSADFHGAIGQSTDSHVLAVVIASMHHVLGWHAPGEQLSSSDIEATRQAHRRIAEAIRDGDGAAAADAMRVHVDEFERLLEEQGRLDEPIIPRTRWLQRGH